MKSVIKRIAEENSVSVEVVKAEMQEAIAEAMVVCSKSKEAESLWRELAPDGRQPSIEEFVLFCVRRLSENRE